MSSRAERCLEAARRHGTAEAAGDLDGTMTTMEGVLPAYEFPAAGQGSPR